MRSHHIYKSTVGLLLVVLLALTGCASEPAPPNHEASPDIESTQDTESAKGVDDVTLPTDLPTEAPLPDYDVTKVTEPDEGGYLFYMRGTDIEADGEALRSMLLDAGFQQMAWGITDEHGANGIFIGETVNVRITVHEVGGEIEVQYALNPKVTD